MNFLRISIFIAIERNAALEMVRVVLGRCDGWIVSHTFFSNISAAINFELPINKAASFVQQLEDAGFKADIAYGMPGAGDGDLRGQLMLSFIHNEPDLRREIPPFG